MPEPAELLLHPARLAVGSAWSTASAWLQGASWTVQITFRAGQLFDGQQQQIATSDGMSSETRDSKLIDCCFLMACQRSMKPASFDLAWILALKAGSRSKE